MAGTGGLALCYDTRTRSDDECGLHLTLCIPRALYRNTALAQAADSDPHIPSIDPLTRSRLCPSRSHLADSPLSSRYPPPDRRRSTNVKAPRKPFKKNTTSTTKTCVSFYSRWTRPPPPRKIPSPQKKSPFRQPRQFVQEPPKTSPQLSRTPISHLDSSRNPPKKHPRKILDCTKLYDALTIHIHSLIL